MKKRAAEKIMMRNELRSQMIKREKYVAQLKDEDRYVEKMILKNNDELM